MNRIYFGLSFNHKLDDIIFPVNCKILKLGWNFSRKIERDKLPINLEWLILGPKYIFEFSEGVLPGKLKMLELSCYGDNSDEYRIRNNKILEKSIIPIGCKIIN